MCLNSINTYMLWFIINTNRNQLKVVNAVGNIYW